MLTTIGSLIIALGLGQADPRMPTAEEVLEKAGKQRRAITRATATLHVASDHSNKGYPSKFVHQLWQDGARLRTDTSYSPKANKPAVSRIMCRNCERDGHSVAYDHGEGTSRAGSVLFEQVGHHNEKLQVRPVDPRVLGLYPGAVEILHKIKMGYLFDRTDRTKPTIERIKWKDRDCYLVRYSLTSKEDVKLAIWIVPSMDYSVTRVEAEGYGKDSVECDLKRYGKDGIWYPKGTAVNKLVILWLPSAGGWCSSTEAELYAAAAG